MTASPDMSRFTSRLHVHSTLRFLTAHRIGAERSQAVDTPDLPVLRDQIGRPYIPGSSLKGAWRAYTEAVLRMLAQGDGVREKQLACNITIEEERCLPHQRVQELRKKLKGAALDECLRQKSCWACKVFGNLWLASKVLIKDLSLQNEIGHLQVRDGVAIDRDAGRAGDGLKYQFEAVPAGAIFDLEILVENASPAELGVVMLGLRAMEESSILLGGARSRGLGWCVLERDWRTRSRYVDADHLLDYLLDETEPDTSGIEEEMKRWRDAFRRELESSDAQTSSERAATDHCD